jgi:hypothetical protein
MSLVTTMMALNQATMMKHQFANQAFGAWDRMMSQANAATGGETGLGAGSSPLNGGVRFGGYPAGLGHDEARAQGSWMMYQAADTYQQAVLAHFAQQQKQKQQNIANGLSLFA